MKAFLISLAVLIAFAVVIALTFPLTVGSTDAGSMAYLMEKKIKPLNDTNVTKARICLHGNKPVFVTDRATIKRLVDELKKVRVLPWYTQIFLGKPRYEPVADKIDLYLYKGRPITFVATSGFYPDSARLSTSMRSRTLSNVVSAIVRENS